MKIKEGLEISSSDFFYDLFYGGYLEPTDICKNLKDAKAVNNAIVLINEFRDSIEADYPEFNS